MDHICCKNRDDFKHPYRAISKPYYNEVKVVDCLQLRILRGDLPRFAPLVRREPWYPYKNIK